MRSRHNVQRFTVVADPWKVASQLVGVQLVGWGKTWMRRASTSSKAASSHVAHMHARTHAHTLSFCGATRVIDTSVWKQAKKSIAVPSSISSACMGGRERQGWVEETRSPGSSCDAERAAFLALIKGVRRPCGSQGRRREERKEEKKERRRKERQEANTSNLARRSSVYTRTHTHTHTYAYTHIVHTARSPSVRTSGSLVGGGSFRPRSSIFRACCCCCGVKRPWSSPCCSCDSRKHCMSACAADDAGEDIAAHSGRGERRERERKRAWMSRDERNGANPSAKCDTKGQ